VRIETLERFPYGPVQCATVDSEQRGVGGVLDQRMPELVCQLGLRFGQADETGRLKGSKAMPKTHGPLDGPPSCSLTSAVGSAVCQPTSTSSATACATRSTYGSRADRLTPAPKYHRSGRKNARTSPTNRSGASMAAKWPPRSNSDQCTMLLPRSP